MFQNGLDLTIKTASTNSPWAYIMEGLLSEGYLHLRFGGLIFGRAYFWGAYYRNFMVFLLLYLEWEVKTFHNRNQINKPKKALVWLTHQLPQPSTSPAESSSYRQASV